jgi:hypothetical protein
MLVHNGDTSGAARTMFAAMLARLSASVALGVVGAISEVSAAAGRNGELAATGGRTRRDDGVVVSGDRAARPPGKRT